MSRLSTRGVLVTSAAAWLLCGCNAGPKPQTPEERNLKALAVLAGQYRGSHKGQMAPNLDALKAHVKKAQPGTLQGLGVDAANLDGLFTSTRDGKPFVYRPSKGSGVPMASPDGKSTQFVVFHEAEGSGGKRWVAYELGGTELVDDAKFKQLVP